MSLQERITKYLQMQPDVWVSGDEIEKKSQVSGYKASTGSRRARELAEDGVIGRKEVEGNVFYGYFPDESTMPKKKLSKFVPVEVDGVTMVREIIEEV